MKKSMLLVAMLMMVVVAIVPALAQDDDFDVTPAEEPVATCAWEPTEFSSPEHPYAPNAGDPSDHVPGEFVDSYESVEAMWAAPQENAKENIDA